MPDIPTPYSTLRRLALCCLLPALLSLGGCEFLGIESAADVAARKDAEGRAIGSACRHAVKSIETCYMENGKAAKSSVFAGWREMDQYMRENNLEGMPTPTGAISANPGGMAAAPQGAPVH